MQSIAPHQGQVITEAPMRIPPPVVGDLYLCLSELAKERTNWDELQILRKRYKEEHEESRRRAEETIRAAQREMEQDERTFARLEAAFDSLENLRVKQEKRWSDEKAKTLRDIQLAVKFQNERPPSPPQDLPASSPSTLPSDGNAHLLGSDGVSRTARAQTPSIRAPLITAVTSAASSDSRLSGPPTAAGVPETARRLGSTPAAETTVATATPLVAILPPELDMSVEEEVSRKREYEQKRREMLERRQKASSEQAQAIRDRRAAIEGSTKDSEATGLTPTTPTPTPVSVSPPAPQLQSSTTSTKSAVVSQLPRVLLSTQQVSKAETAAVVQAPKPVAAKPPPNPTSPQATSGMTVVPRKRPAENIAQIPHDGATSNGSPANAVSIQSGSKRSRVTPPVLPQKDLPAVYFITTQDTPRITTWEPQAGQPPVERFVAMSVKREPSPEPTLSSLSSALSSAISAQTLRPYVPVASVHRESPPSPTFATVSGPPHAVRPTFNDGGDRSTRIIKTTGVSSVQSSSPISPISAQTNKPDATAAPQRTQVVTTRAVQTQQQPQRSASSVHPVVPAPATAYPDPMVNSDLPSHPRSPSPHRGHDLYPLESGSEYTHPFGNRRSPPSPRAMRGQERARPARQYDHYSPPRSPVGETWRARYNDERPYLSRGRSRSPDRARTPPPMDYRGARWEDRRNDHEEARTPFSAGELPRVSVNQAYPPSSYYESYAAPSQAQSRPVAVHDSGWPRSPSPERFSPNWGSPARSEHYASPVVAPYTHDYFSAGPGPSYVPAEPDSPEPRDRDLLYRLSTDNGRPSGGRNGSPLRRGKNARGRGGRKSGASGGRGAAPTTLAQRIRPALGDRIHK
ncbi:hypothetical protein EUX98_g3417 [Antrodiella citrinella]|uniref:Uncharacterized protein n=1 Tax=Antrodiella citrinella TaxID=2447956 RepID=A0A4S4MWM5_9APHY|nr:hypothetical protein EUX98_g3417 [Antrodiella citrinella]